MDSKEPASNTQARAEYRQNLIKNYPRLHKDIYEMDAENIFTPSFLCAIDGNTEADFREIMDEPCPGVFTFEILQPLFCEKLICEVDNFLRWTEDNKIQIMRPNVMHQHGAILDDFGLEPMLRGFRKNFIQPITRVFFYGFGGASLDSHHAFVVDYGITRDGEVDLHMDDADITLNICLGYEFTGGQLYFRGARCDDHRNTGFEPEEMFDYCHVPGRAILHGGRHRHGATATTSGRRLNLIFWLRSSSVRRKSRILPRDCSGWCGECMRDEDVKSP